MADEHGRRHLAAMREVSEHLRAEYQRIRAVYGLPETAHAMIIVVDPPTHEGAVMVSHPDVLAAHLGLEDMIAYARQAVLNSLANGLVKIEVDFEGGGHGRH